MGTFNIDGRTFSGQNINIVNNEVWIDGKKVDGKLEGKVELRILEGTVESIHSDGNIHAEGIEIKGNVDAGMNVTCGDVTGDVDARMGVRCGTVGGDVKAGMSVTCGDVAGSVDAGMGVSMGKHS